MLVIIAPVRPDRKSDGTLALDDKFTTGMAHHCRVWPAPVRVLLRQPGDFRPGEPLPDTGGGYELRLFDPQRGIDPADLQGAGLILASADMDETLSLPALIGPGQKLVYSIEYPLETRLRILALDRDRSQLRKLRSLLWLLRQERRRRRAFRAADALQANGFPAEQAYARLTPDLLMYLDGRMSEDLFATPAEVARREARLRAGEPLRIAHSGRLERMKGSQDLLPFARALLQQGIRFSLDIYGAGSLAADIHQGLADPALRASVRLHEPLPFASGLVPRLRNEADLFLTCHRQSDPSCSYIEAMGCGLAVAGYDNHMWQGLSLASGSGQVVPMGRPEALAAAIAAWDRDREALISQNRIALDYARAHDFTTEFDRRMEHLARVRSG